MKKVIIFLVSLLLSVSAFGQNLQLQIGKDNSKIVFEADKFVNNDYFYGYVEVGTDLNPYAQLIYEHSFWKGLGIHTEFRTDFNTNMYFLGPMWTFVLPKGCIMVEPLCRYEGGQFYWQGSVVASFDWKWCDLYGYIDVWGQREPMVYSEIKWFAKVNEHLGLGASVNFMYFGKFDCIPYLGIRYSF